MTAAKPPEDEKIEPRQPQMLDELLSRAEHAEVVRSISDDPDLATT